MRAAITGQARNSTAATCFQRRSQYILPCLSRTEQATGNQAVTTEDSFSHISGSVGKRTSASKALKSELAIVTGIAKVTIAPHPKLKWDDWTGDYGLVRDLIEYSYPSDFKDYNSRMSEPGGFYRGYRAHEREWKTPEKKALFTTPDQLSALSFADTEGRYPDLFTGFSRLKIVLLRPPRRGSFTRNARIGARW